MSDLIELVGFTADRSLLEDRVADALDWLSVALPEVESLPGGERFSALMWLLADEQRRLNHLRRLRPETVERLGRFLRYMIEREDRRAA